MTHQNRSLKTALPSIIMTSVPTYKSATAIRPWLCTVLFYCIPLLSLNAQNPNWVETSSYTYDNNGNEEEIRSRTFTDGLGRVIQTQTQDNVERNKFISGTVYDKAGRPVKSVKPYKLPGNSDLSYHQAESSIIDEANKYHESPNPGEVGGCAFSEIQYNEDPIGKVTATGAPGAAYSISNNHYTWTTSLGVQGPGSQRHDAFASSGFIKYEYLYDHERDIANKKYVADIQVDEIKYTLTVTRDPNGHFTQTLTDLYGRTRFTWAKAGNNAEQTTDEIINEYKYDVLGNRLSETPPPCYDREGNSVDPVNPTSYTYNTRGQVLTRTTPDAGTVTYDYDNAGRLQTTTDANGTKLRYTYDKMGRQLTTELEYSEKFTPRIRTIYDDPAEADRFLSQSRIPSDIITSRANTRGRVVATIAYDNNFSGTSQNDENAYEGKIITLYSYDDDGRVEVKITSIPGVEIDCRKYTYDNQGKLILTEYLSGFLTRHGTWREYDANGRLWKINFDGKQYIQYNYDDQGRMSGKQYDASGKYSCTYSYTIRDWVKTISASNNGEGYTEKLFYDDAATSQYNGNIGDAVHRYNSTDPATTIHYTYDGVNRLTGAASDDEDDFDASFSYHNDGRILTKNESVNSGWGMYEYNKNTNRLSGIASSPKSGTNYIYDANGNMILDRSKNMIITYDWRNMPVKFSIYDNIPTDVDGGESIRGFMERTQCLNEVTMTYDAGGNRVKKETTTPDGKIAHGVAYWDDAVFGYSSESNSYVFSYVKIDDDFIFRNNGGKEYYVRDHLGSIRQVIGSDGQVKEAIDYYAYGAQKHRVTCLQEALETFTGKEFDEEAGIDAYYFGARYYDPQVGIWMSPDPAGQFWNGYGYAGNGANPINGVDPNGQIFLIDDLAIIGLGFLVSSAATYVIKSLDNAINKKMGWSGFDITNWDNWTNEGVSTAINTNGDGQFSINGGDPQNVQNPFINRPNPNKPFIPQLVPEKEKEDQSNPDGVIADGQTGTGGGSSITLQFPSSSIYYQSLGSYVSGHNEFGPVNSELDNRTWNYDFSASSRGMSEPGIQDASLSLLAMMPIFAPVKAAKSLTALRAEYVQEVLGLEHLGNSIRAAGLDAEATARILHAERRALGVQYKNLTPADELAKIYNRNLNKYGDKLGPSIDYLRGQGKSWEDIIRSSYRTGGKDLGY